MMYVVFDQYKVTTKSATVTVTTTITVAITRPIFFINQGHLVDTWGGRCIPLDPHGIRVLYP